MTVFVDRGAEITGKRKENVGACRGEKRGMKFLAVERARETTMGKLVGILRLALMETITEISTVEPTGLTNHTFVYCNGY